MEPRRTSEPLELTAPDTTAVARIDETATPREDALSPTAAEPDSDEVEALFVIRAGTFYLEVSHDHRPDRTFDTDLPARLVKALQDDSRVTQCDAPSMDPDWSPHLILYPTTASVRDSAGVFSGERHFHAQKFSKPIWFEVHVPKKNQPTTHADDVVPTEDYRALWDGETLLVAWQMPESSSLGWGGGHVIADVVTEASKRIGCDVYVQPCRPNCEHMFVHRDIFLGLGPSLPRWKVRPPQRGSVVRIFARGTPSLTDAADVAWRNSRSTFREFADLKNASRRLVDLEYALRYRLDQLSELHRARAAASLLPWGERIFALWRLRAWRRESRARLAELWQGVGTFEHFRQRWVSEEAEFARGAKRASLRPLFEADVDDEVDYVRSIDLTFIRAALEHLSTPPGSTPAPSSPPRLVVASPGRSSRRS